MWIIGKEFLNVRLYLVPILYILKAKNGVDGIVIILSYSLLIDGSEIVIIATCP